MINFTSIQHNWGQQSRAFILIFLPSLSFGCWALLKKSIFWSVFYFCMLSLISACCLWSLNVLLFSSIKKSLTFQQKLFVKFTNTSKRLLPPPAICPPNQFQKEKTKRNIKAEVQAPLSSPLIHLSNLSHWKQSAFAVSGPPVWSFSTITKLEPELSPHSSPFLHNMNKTCVKGHVTGCALIRQSTLLILCAHIRYFLDCRINYIKAAHSWIFFFGFLTSFPTMQLGHVHLCDRKLSPLLHGW